MSTHPFRLLEALRTTDRRSSTWGRSLILSVLACVVGAPLARSQFPDVQQGNVRPGDRRLGRAMPESGPDELTLASFNVRNWGTRNRNLSHFEAIADLVDEADVVVFQEVGLGLHDSDSEVSEDEARRLDAIVALLRVFLGAGWSVELSPASGSGASAENSILAWRTNPDGYTIKARWDDFVDLAEPPRRDMAVWELELKQGNRSRTLLLGSVHLKPDDPERGEEMIKVADWLEQHEDELAIACGDFNWGYRKKSRVTNYKGEDHVEQLHDDGKICLLFRPLSSRNGADSDQLRTNMGFRKTGYFYDQFLLTSGVAEMMADDGELLKDCGMIAFGLHLKAMKDARKKLKARRTYALQKFVKDYQKVFEWSDLHQEMLDKAEEASGRSADDESTYLISDHRLIWMQIKPFGS